jgi:hypothetical protein
VFIAVILWLMLVAAGLVTWALVALPVVMSSTAYVVGAHFNWRRGLSERAGRARRFCAILAAMWCTPPACGISSGVPGMACQISTANGPPRAETTWHSTA